MPGLFDKVFKTIENKLTQHQLKQLINIQDEEGNTAILYVAFKGNLKVLNTLMDKGGDIFLRNNSGLSVMHMAAQGDRANLLIYLKDKFGMNILDRDNSGNTPLHWACYTSAENSLNFLISWMDDINVVDKQGQTPLHIAIHTFSPIILKKLLFKGANVEKKDNNGKSVLAIIQEGRNNPDYDKIFRIITDFKPMKFCFIQTNTSSRKQEKSFFNSYLFLVLHILSEAITYFVLLKEINSLILYVIFYIFLGLLIVSFAFARLFNPGILLPNDNLTWIEMVEKQFPINNYCPWCRVFKKLSTKHCHSCKHCIEGFDHHCNWIDNCVGKSNSGIFMSFVIVILLNLIVCYYIALTAFLIKDSASIQTKGGLGFAFIFLHTPKDVFAIFIMSVCILFFVPVVYVLWIQIKSRCFKKAPTKKAFL